MKHHGLSLPELMVTLAIVSVVGAGAIVGIRQLQEGQDILVDQARQTANAELLLPILEMEQARHGQQVSSNTPPCLVRFDTSTGWQNSCNPGDEFTPPGQGFLTCRRDNENTYYTLVLFAEATNDDGDSERALFKETWQPDPASSACDLADPPSSELFENAAFDPNKYTDIQTQSATALLLSDEVDSYTVNYAADGISLVNEIQFDAAARIVTEGNVSRVQTDSIEFGFTTTNNLLESNLPAFQFATDRLNIASGSQGQIYVVADRPVLRDTDVAWQLGDSSGTVTLYAGQTQSSGAISIPFASAAKNLRLVAGEDYLLAENSEVEFSTEQNFKPHVRTRLAQSTLAYGGNTETLEVFLTGQASGATAVGLTIDSSSCTQSGNTYTLDYDSSDSCAITVNFSDQASVPETLPALKASTSGADGIVTLTIDAPSGDNYYGTVGTEDLTIGLTSDLPTVEFLSTESVAIEPAVDSLTHQVVLLSDRPLRRATTIKLTASSDDATCGATGDYQVDGQTCGTSFTTVFPAGEFEHRFSIEVLADSINDDDEAVTLSIASGAYAIAENNQAHQINLSEYSVVEFADASISSITEADGTANLTLNITPDAATDLKLYFASAAVSGSNTWIDWSFNTNPVSVAQGASSATLVLDIDNDTVPEGTEKVQIKFKTLADGTPDFIGEAVAGQQDATVLTVTDQSSDLCFPAGDLTIGNTATKHFNDTEGTDTVTNATIKGGSVQITDGFVTSDRLALKGATPTTTTNLLTYSNYNATINGTTYVFDATYTITSGVLRLDLDTAGSNPDTITATHLVSFFNDFVTFTVADFSQTAARKILFTLGNAQAWDKHEDGTVHYYQFIEDDGGTESGGNNVNNDGINFIDAFKAARDTDYFGVPGYLATVTSRVENDFLATKFRIDGAPISGWLGGSNKKTSPLGSYSGYSWPSGLGDTNSNSNGFRFGWLDGPEKGRLFWSGVAACGDPIQHSNGSIIDVFPKNTNTSGVIDEPDIQANRCQFHYGDSSATEWPSVTNTLSCVDQTVAFNGNAHVSGTSPHQMKYGYDYDDEIVDGKVDPSQNIYRFSNFGCSRNNDKFHQPDFSGNDEYFLQLTGQAIGGKMWNDLRNDPDKQASASKKIYEIKGYYVEWGGPDSSSFGFAGKKLSQTNTVTPYKCQVQH